MKLKKFAAMMLAGVMAVSMLAGCEGKGTTDDNGGNGQNQTEQVVSNAVNYANQTLSSTAKKYMTYESAGWLDTALKNTATNKSDFTADNIVDVFGGTNEGGIWNYDSEWANTMAEKIVDSMSGKEAYTHDGYDNHSFEMVPANKESKSIVWVYTLSGVMTEEMAVTNAALEVSNWMAENVLGQPIDNGNYDCEYTAEISALKVTNSNLTVQNAWVVAIVVNQNVTKAANTTV